MYATVNLLFLAPGAFFVWMAVVVQEYQFVLGLIGGGLLVGAFMAIGERRSNR